MAVNRLQIFILRTHGCTHGFRAHESNPSLMRSSASGPKACPRQGLPSRTRLCAQHSLLSLRQSKRAAHVEWGRPSCRRPGRSPPGESKLRPGDRCQRPFHETHAVRRNFGRSSDRNPHDLVAICSLPRLWMPLCRLHVSCKFQARVQ